MRLGKIIIRNNYLDIRFTGFAFFSLPRETRKINCAGWTEELSAIRQKNKKDVANESAYIVGTLARRFYMAKKFLAIVDTGLKIGHTVILRNEATTNWLRYAIDVKMLLQRRAKRLKSSPQTGAFRSGRRPMRFGSVWTFWLRSHRDLSTCAHTAAGTTRRLGNSWPSPIPLVLEVYSS